jgi:hypothetical protein
MSLYVFAFPRDGRVLDDLPHRLNEIKVLLTGVREKIAFEDPACTFIITCNCDVAVCDVVEGADAGDHDGYCIQSC